jgi:hypothetical protein
VRGLFRYAVSFTPASRGVAKVLDFWCLPANFWRSVKCPGERSKLRLTLKVVQTLVFATGNISVDPANSVLEPAQVYTDASLEPGRGVGRAAEIWIGGALFVSGRQPVLFSLRVCPSSFPPRLQADKVHIGITELWAADVGQRLFYPLYKPRPARHHVDNLGDAHQLVSASSKCWVSLAVLIAMKQQDYSTTAGPGTWWSWISTERNAVADAETRLTKVTAVELMVTAEFGAHEQLPVCQRTVPWEDYTRVWEMLGEMSDASYRLRERRKKV